MSFSELKIERKKILWSGFNFKNQKRKYHVLLCEFDEKENEWTGFVSAVNARKTTFIVTSCKLGNVCIEKTMINVFGQIGH